MDQALIEESIRNIFKAIGEDANRPGIQETPTRVARMYEEIFSTLETPDFINYKLFDTDDSINGEMITVADIPFYSMCEHHLLPFFGTVSVGYIPKNNKVIGLSKIPRLVDYATKKPTLQEEVTSTIGNTLMDILDPAGVAVFVKARHMCVEMRGVKKSNSMTKSSFYRGGFTNIDTQQEFFNTLNN
ncbi:GTP cyclohydrolase I FolE [Weissella minor]|uniref:GTP cyclohydrolase 1 n=1 Tax=Weissella minor TaxID=1620 RepID=A0A0R2JIA0_9LACO|nr:GTP cyclohydrolase I FolE [Weissella minor]KRN77032.1 GTP cyclohydrolase I [Weissella minor]